MAIYKRGQIWWMDVYVGNGKRRVRRSTGCKDEVQARLVEQSAVAVNKGLTSRRRVQGVLEALFPVEERSLAVGEIAAYYRQVMGEDGRVLSARAMAHRVSVLAAFAAWCQRSTRVVTVDEVDAEVAFAFMRSLNVGGGRSAKTRNAYVGELGTAWKVFQRHGKAKENPWGLVRVERNRAEERTGRAFTDAEIQAIRSVAREVGCDWEGAILIALYTGLRQGDATHLRWADIDFELGVIRVRPSKTRRHGVEVVLPMHPVLRSWLEGRGGAARGEWVTPLRVGRRVGDVGFNEVLRRAGVVAREGEKLSFHCFRHTFVTRLAEAGVAPDVRMRLAGHTSAANHAIYTHDLVSARRAVDGLTYGGV